MSDRKTVWILGAGFSRSLGGPLLGDLLSPSGRAGVESFYGDNPLLTSDAANLVRNVVEHHEIERKGRSPFWNDAEEFLDQLDAAAARPGASKRFRVLFAQGALGAVLEGADMAALRGAARRLIAAECCSFLEEANLDEERWAPYRSWAETLKFPDVILTFNYDRVLETLGRFVIVPPDGSYDNDGKAAVFKLHGSVDWQRLEGPPVNGVKGRYSSTTDPRFALTCADYQIGIATPGPTKRISTKELEAIWDGALAHLKEADAIVFVGYRFPPTDAEAREKLLGAIRENRSSQSGRSHHLYLHIVLGPNRADANVERLTGLLGQVMAQAGRIESGPVTHTETFSIGVHPLYAEDFFTVSSPGTLYQLPGRRG